MRIVESFFFLGGSIFFVWGWVESFFWGGRNFFVGWADFLFLGGRFFLFGEGEGGRILGEREEGRGGRIFFWCEGRIFFSERFFLGVGAFFFFLVRAIFFGWCDFVLGE